MPLLQDLHCAWQRAVDVNPPYKELPSDLDALVSDFVRLEDGSPERFRYPLVKLHIPKKIFVKTSNGIKKDELKRQQSFGKQVVIPVQQLQARLEALVDHLFWKDDADLNVPIDSLGYELASESSHLYQELYYQNALGELVPDPSGNS